MRRAILFVPLAAFILFVILFAVYLRAPSDTTIRSQLIGRPLPEFALAPALPRREMAISCGASAMHGTHQLAKTLRILGSPWVKLARATVSRPGSAGASANSESGRPIS